jgi:hypothetical protein
MEDWKTEVAARLTGGEIVSIEPCGSRVTCDPAPLDTDEDFLVEISPKETDVGEVVNCLGGLHFHWEGGEHYQMAADTFMSWRRGNVNLIVTANKRFADRHRTATWLCKRLNLLNKQDRIALFQAVLYGEQWTGKGDAPFKPADPVMDFMS